MSELEARLAAGPVAEVRSALAEEDGAWLVGGTIRDALLEREIGDVDLAVAGDPERAARAVARALGGPVFPLSEAFGAWRAIAAERAFVCDVSPLQGATIEEDLAKRDFTVNAMATPLAGGDLLDPHGGREDLERRTLRVVSEGAYEADRLRPLRLVRLAAELGLRPDEATERLTAQAAPSVAAAAPERVFAELRRLLLAADVLGGLELADRLGLLRAVLPELDALHDVEQSHFHHLDVYGHTVEVLRRQLALEDEIEDVFGELAPRVERVLAEPLADELTHGQALRFAALLHDVGKPPTRRVLPNGRVTFIGHDSVGAAMVDCICERLRTSRALRDFVAGITRTHLALGFLVHERPLSRRTLYRYLDGCDPVEVEVTVLSCADRLATRGRNAEPAIAAHLEVAREVMAAALDWRADGPPAPPLRGDELAGQLGIEPGPELGAVLAELREAAYAGEVTSQRDAIEAARRIRENQDR